MTQQPGFFDLSSAIGSDVRIESMARVGNLDAMVLKLSDGSLAVARFLIDPFKVDLELEDGSHHEIDFTPQGDAE